MKVCKVLLANEVDKNLGHNMENTLVYMSADGKTLLGTLFPNKSSTCKDFALLFYLVNMQVKQLMHRAANFLKALFLLCKGNVLKGSESMGTPSYLLSHPLYL